MQRVADRICAWNELLQRRSVQWVWHLQGQGSPRYIYSIKHSAVHGDFCVHHPQAQIVSDYYVFLVKFISNEAENKGEMHIYVRAFAFCSTDMLYLVAGVAGTIVVVALEPGEVAAGVDVQEVGLRQVPDVHGHVEVSASTSGRQHGKIVKQRPNISLYFLL